jgi:hypothetical protein
VTADTIGIFLMSSNTLIEKKIAQQWKEKRIYTIKIKTVLVQQPRLQLCVK